MPRKPKGPVGHTGQTDAGHTRDVKGHVHVAILVGFARRDFLVPVPAVHGGLEPLKVRLYLTQAGIVALTEETGLIGHDGWADGRLGDDARSEGLLNDYRLIEELAGLDKEARRVDPLKLLGLLGVVRHQAHFALGLRLHRHIADHPVLEHPGPVLFGSLGADPRADISRLQLRFQKELDSECASLFAKRRPGRALESPGIQSWQVPQLFC